MLSPGPRRAQTNNNMLQNTLQPEAAHMFGGFAPTSKVKHVFRCSGGRSGERRDRCVYEAAHHETNADSADVLPRANRN